MAVYKVPQDVEADDKLIGFLSFKQFIFVIIMVVSLFFAYQMFRIYPPLGLIPMPMAVFFGLLGLWPRRDQPAEVYLAAIIQFWLKPRKRIWNQEGHVEHVRITAPKFEHHEYTDGLSHGEVKSRLKQLAGTMDTRGWSTKNVELQDVGNYTQSQWQQSDRLVMPSIVQTQQVIDVHESDDMMDEVYNPVARNVAELTAQYEQRTRQSAINHMQAQIPGSGNDLSSAKVSYQPYPEMRQKRLNPHPEQHKQTAHTDKKRPTKKPDTDSTSTMTQEQSAAILNLSKNNDFNLSTLSRKAEQALHDDETIELH